MFKELNCKQKECRLIGLSLLSHDIAIFSHGFLLDLVNFFWKGLIYKYFFSSVEVFFLPKRISRSCFHFENCVFLGNYSRIYLLQKGFGVLIAEDESVGVWWMILSVWCGWFCYLSQVTRPIGKPRIL